MIVFVVAITSNGEDFSEDDAPETSSCFYTEIEENNLSMWKAWIKKKIKKQTSRLIVLEQSEIFPPHYETLLQYN